MKKLFTSVLALALGSSTFAQVQLQSHSVTPALVKVNVDVPGLNAYPLIGSDDVLPQSPGYIFGGSADGAGLIKNLDGTYTYIVNHEDNFAVSRVNLDATFKPFRGNYLLTSKAGMWRLCSATLATPEENGFGPKFLTSGESGAESMTHALNINDGTHATFDSATLAKGLGRWSAENAFPLHKDAYVGKTVIVIGEDDSGVNGGQLLMYVANAVGELNNGKLYVLRRKDLNKKERDMVSGTAYPVELIEFPENYKSMTGKKLDELTDTMKAIKFGRVEDIDAGKGSVENHKNVYFTVTGQDYAGVNADKSRTKFGRVYRLTLNPVNPLEGTLTCIMDGDDTSPSNPARAFYDVDNICVTKDYVYVQEDPNGYTLSAEESAHNHDARIYQYDIETGAIKILLELDHHRSAPDSAKYNQKLNSASGEYEYARSKTGSWEFGSMIDISDVIGQPDVFMIAVQPHTWVGKKYRGVDTIVNGGANTRKNEDQASQIIVVTGVPREKKGTSISEKNTKANIQVYPNPSNGQFSISVVLKEAAVLEVLNAIGQVVYSDKVQGSGFMQKELNLSHLAKGNYVLRVREQNNTNQQVVTIH